MVPIYYNVKYDIMVDDYLTVTFSDFDPERRM